MFQSKNQQCGQQLDVSELKAIHQIEAWPMTRIITLLVLNVGNFRE